MKSRVITGIVYMIVMAGLLTLKLMLPVKDGLDFGALGFDVLFTLISVIGAYEFTRAIGEHNKEGDGGISKIQRWTAIITCALTTPVFVAVKMLSIKLTGNMEEAGVFALVAMLAVISLGAIITATMTVFDHDRSDLKSTAYAELCILYCGALVATGANINHFQHNSQIAILLLCVIVPATDAFAFFFGMMFGKLLPLKLAPKTSPNKTVIGAIGGLIGGIVSAIGVWILAEFVGNPVFIYDGSLPDLLALMLIALPTSAIAQIGDLFESAVKRGCGIKDMGKLLPGHGGVLDRFDSMMFATVPIAISFMII
ncbi:MAG: phosphatidate cytidylyltransferase [Candidatus Coproplasma sp.]